MGKFDQAIADCNSVIEKYPKYQYALVTAAPMPIMAKGNLDAALKDYNFVLGLNPNNVRAHARPRPVFREAARSGAGARRLSFGGASR